MFPLQLLQIIHPYIPAGIAWHTQITTRGDRHASDLRAIRQTGTLELLCKEAAVERGQPFQDYLRIVDASKSITGHTINFGWRIAEAHYVIQEEIMKLIRSDKIFCLLGNLSVLRRKKLRADRCIEHIIQDRADSFSSPHVSA